MTTKTSVKFRELKVTSIIEILQELQKLPDLKLFRGQSDSSWSLVPRIGRLFGESHIPDTWDRMEYFMIEEFRQYSVPYIEKEPRNDFEWLVLGQHYGLPTRILDWTTNPLKADFWAVNDSQKDCDSALFGFSPTSLLRDLDDNESIRDFQDVMPVFPRMIDSRIIAQESCFIVFPFPPENKVFEPLENESIHGNSYWHLLKMIIPYKCKSTILDDLEILGVSSKSLFPDLTGLAQFIELEWKKKARMMPINRRIIGRTSR